MRTSSGVSALVAMTPVSVTTARPGPGSTSAQPVPTSPGSIPRTLTPTAAPGTARLSSRDGLENLVGNVVVGVDVLDVVQVLQRLDQAHHRRGGGTLDPDGGLRHVRHLRLEDRNTRFRQPVTHRVHFSRRGGDLENFFDPAHVGGASLERLAHQIVLADLLGVDLAAGG